MAVSELKKLLQLESLNTEESRSLMLALAEGLLSESEIAAMLVAFNLRGVSALEILGFRQAILEKAIRPEIEGNGLVDVCGTGGDGKDTFNISTATAFLLASMGYRVAKHGNNAFSSSCGSSNVLQELGIKLSADSEILRQCLEKCQVCFLHAPFFHPSLKRAAEVRRQLGVRTIFNLLGPLVNPIQPEFQICGVANLQILALYRQVWAESKRKYVIVHAEDGYDEISLTGKFVVHSDTRAFEFWPEELGIPRLCPQSLGVDGTVAGAAEVLRNLFNGAGSREQKSVVAINAAVIIQRIRGELDLAKTYQECYQMLETDRLAEILKELIKITNG